jgi:hypothetical protein
MRQKFCAYPPNVSREFFFDYINTRICANVSPTGNAGIRLLNLCQFCVTAVVTCGCDLHETYFRFSGKCRFWKVFLSKLAFGLSNIYDCSATIIITSSAGNFHESYCIAVGMKNHCIEVITAHKTGGTKQQLFRLMSSEWEVIRVQKGLAMVLCTCKYNICNK